VLKPSAVVELVWQDETGSTSATTLFASSSATFEEIDAGVTALASFLAPLTGGVLIKQRVKYVSAPFDPVLLTGGSPITKTGLLFFSTGPSTPDGSVAIPGFKDSLLVTSGPCSDTCIDLTNSDVVSFAAAIVDNGISNPFGDVFLSLFAGYVQSRV